MYRVRFADEEPRNKTPSPFLLRSYEQQVSTKLPSSYYLHPEDGHRRKVVGFVNCASTQECRVIPIVDAWQVHPRIAAGDVQLEAAGQDVGH